MSKKITHEMYVKRLSEVNPNIEVIEEYKGYDTKIKHKCKIDGFEWYARPGNILHGRGCPECKKNKSCKLRTKTHEQYILELKKKKIEIVPLEEYKGNDVKIKHKCLKHDYVWEVRPGNILSGKGCPICKSETIKKKKTKDAEWYKEQLAEKKIQIIPLEEYKIAKTKIKHLCLKHNVEWYISPDSVLRGRGCPQCGKEKLREQHIKSQEEYIKELKEVNPELEVIGKYQGCETKIVHHCLKHNVYWETCPSNALKGGGCPKCLSEKMSEIRSMDYDDFMDLLTLFFPDYELIGEYKNLSTKTTFHCLKHDVYWDTLPLYITEGKGCPECTREKNSKSHDEYIKDVARINPDIEVLGRYKNADTPILHRCKRDGYEWLVAPHCVMAGSGCPICNETTGEREVRQFLEENNVSYTLQKRFNDCRDEKPLPFDFYLPDYNAIIEYDGEQHYFPINFSGKGELCAEERHNITKRHDEIKNEYCSKNNISLLRIPYFKDIKTEITNFLFT